MAALGASTRMEEAEAHDACRASAVADAKDARLGRHAAAMLALGLPRLLLVALLILRCSANLLQTTDLDALELFAGDRSVSLGLLECPAGRIVSPKACLHLCRCSAPLQKTHSF